MHENERRKHQRLSGSSIQTSLKRKGFLSFSSYKSVKVVDYSRFGVGIVHNEKYRMGDELLFSFSKQNEHIEHVVGFVCYIKELDEGYSYGIQFDFSANKHMRSENIEKALTRIEKLLDKTVRAECEIEVPAHNNAHAAQSSTHH
jgi:hypothetical protein